MGRHSGPVCRQCRREGERLLLKGDRCYSDKCAMAKRTYPPGMNGRMMRKQSDYAIRLREKQRTRRFYGVSEKQLRHYYEIADRKPGVTGLLFLQYLESRFDNIIYRLGLAYSRKEARQRIKHGHFLINGRKVDIPSYKVKEKDKITIKEKSQKVFDVILDKNKDRTYPAWIQFNPTTREGEMISLPERDDIDVPVSEQLIVEFYAK